MRFQNRIGGFVNWRLDYQRRQRDCRQLLWSFQICRESGSVPNPMVKNIVGFQKICSFIFVLMNE